MDYLSNVDVLIITRDKDGVRRQFEMRWDDLSNEDMTDGGSSEILCIIADTVCVYSRLMSGPITMEDVRNFFAYYHRPGLR